MRQSKTKFSAAGLSRTAIFAGAYAAITIAFAPISYGPFFQLRVSEALTVLPFISRHAVFGLFLGCVVANLYGGLGILDVTLGSAATLLAAWLTSKLKKPALAPLPPVVINAIVVGWYLSILAQVPFWVTAGWVALGEVIACYGIGYPMLLWLLRRPKLVSLLRG